MFPIALNISSIPVLLIGQGELLARRHTMLKEWGAQALTVMETEVTDVALDGFSIVMAAGLPRAQSEALATRARALGKLINIEDVNELCDFYFTANVRRGDLIIAVSTCGASPTAARKIRDAIAGVFGHEWAERLEAIASLRKSWRAEGKSMDEVVKRTESILTDKGWLDFKRGIS